MRRGRWIAIGAGGAAGLFALFVLAVAGYAVFVLEASKPCVGGVLRLAGLDAPVTVTRDVEGIPTVTAASRTDLARAMGFLHAQERFFQMDLQRRASAGELSGLVGAVALPLDRSRRLHRFRAHAGIVFGRQSPAAQALLRAYADGVNAGLAALGHAPFEYALLRTHPDPWQPQDTLLVVYSMYLSLQEQDGGSQALRARLAERLGPEMAAFLDPEHTPLDAPDDDATSVPPALPDHVASPTGGGSCAPPSAPPAERGSNSFAVAGSLTSTGSAMLANDMHLELGVPNIWYRARQVLAQPGTESLEMNGVTLPGTPLQVVGSNGRIAWGYTDGYIESGDLVRLESLAPATRGGPFRYATPDGPRDIATIHEKLCPLRGVCQDMAIAQTIWGPVYGHDETGAPLVWRWAAEDDDAVGVAGLLALERAGSVRDALDAAHRSALPQQNLLVADRNGHIGWTVIGRVPRRIGLDDRLPHSWADGSHRWAGWLDAAEIPEIVDPPSGRLWTANGRMVGGAALRRLGDGGYADGLRAGQIRDDLFARQRFMPADFLAIQTDDHAIALRPWQQDLLAAFDRQAAQGKAQPGDDALRDAVVHWGEHAVPGSIGYRLVHQWRAHALRVVFGAWEQAACLPAEGAGRPRLPARSAWAVQVLLHDRPAGLVPPGHAGWDAVEAQLLDLLRADVRRAGGLAHFTWGAVNHVGIHHPLARAVPLLGRLTDPADLPEAGDTVVPRVQVPGFGASERLVVSPGHEAAALLEMPGGQGGNPLSDYGDAGQVAWQEGRQRPLLPGPVVSSLRLLP